jgi:hypothetical protein
MGYCKYDTDGDGNCHLHPQGCPTHPPIPPGQDMIKVISGGVVQLSVKDAFGEWVHIHDTTPEGRYVIAAVAIALLWQEIHKAAYHECVVLRKHIELWRAWGGLDK